MAQLAERDSLRLGDREQKGGLGLGGSPESGLSRSPSRFFPFRLSSMDCRCRCPTISGTTSPNEGGLGEEVAVLLVLVVFYLEQSWDLKLTRERRVPTRQRRGSGKRLKRIREVV